MNKQVRPLKCRIQAAAKPGVTRVDVYEDIGGGDGFFVPQGLSAAEFVNTLSGIRGDLEVHINSNGGDVFDGIAISNAISGHKGNVTTVVDGIAASIASVIAQAGQHRVMQSGAMMMIHDAFGGCMGNEKAMRDMADTLAKVSDNLANIYAQRSRKDSPAVWRNRMRDETWYTAEEAVVAGLADALDSDVQAHLPTGTDMAAFAGVPSRIAARLVALSQVKVYDGAIGVHHTDTVDSSWDGGKAKKGFPNDAEVLHYCNAWETSGSGDQKGDYKFPHHMTKGGPANLAACRNGLARLPGSKIPANDKPGVEAHLRAHLKDGGATDAENSLDYFVANFKKLTIGVEVGPVKLPTDQSAWEPIKAIRRAEKAEDPEAYFRAICAGRKAGDPTLASSWCLPYRMSPKSEPSEDGVRLALAQLAMEKDLTNGPEARKFLTDLMNKIDPGFDSGDVDTRLLAALFTQGLRGA